ncbi:proline-rich receptor-like protein kinase PERK3 [Nicotiana tomentosiformis]|uniref:proline-rich receptor-like protein kinase PERK3 n=1 Tax=Nicotiana tomentosiformis TaxID=4098 RepID=UPI00051BE0AF|nr:proline-rich receptor-like protein kinase PERK3 [Nicotiana tomentosiformis]
MNRGEIIIIYNVILVILSIIITILVILLFICCKKKPIKAEETLPTKQSASSYSLMDIHTATDGFNYRRIIGQGRIGSVYAAILPNGEQVAVKRIHPRLVLSNAGLGFSSIMKWLSLVDHPNIVPILGFSEAPGERIVVMEFEGMLSLDFYLHQNYDGAALLDWSCRLRIAAGVAKGIEYLHEVMAPNIIHGCIKPSNILIDVKFCARICDYGLYFFLRNNYERKLGLMGYVDEEYWIEKKGGSKESDVYGLGVVLLELLSGRRNSDNQENLLVKWALPLIKEMKFSEFLDPRLVIPSDTRPLVRLAKVALACVGNSRKSRPSIVQVAAILTSLEVGLSS